MIDFDGLADCFALPRYATAVREVDAGLLVIEWTLGDRIVGTASLNVVDEKHLMIHNVAFPEDMRNEGRIVELWKRLDDWLLKHGFESASGTGPPATQAILWRMGFEHHVGPDGFLGSDMTDPDRKFLDYYRWRRGKRQQPKWHKDRGGDSVVADRDDGNTDLSDPTA